MKRKTSLFFVSPLLIWILNCSLIAIFTSYAFSQDESLTITTYYPSPHGVYKVLRIYPNDDFLPGSSCTNEGELYYDSSEHNLYVCSGSPLRWNPITTQIPFTQFRVFDCTSVNTSCITTWQVPVGISRIMVEVWGGGGAGADDDGNGGASGAGGGYGKDIFDVSAGEVYTVSVGGIASNGITGTNGFNSTLRNSGGTILIGATGGGGGTGVTAGHGGISSAPFNITGGDGSVRYTLHGGDAANGGSGGISYVQDFVDGKAPGGGGAGGVGGTTGGRGAQGRVVIWW